MTATTVGERLQEELVTLRLETRPLPPRRPAVRGDGEAAGSQTTRMLKLECPDDGYIVRTTQKWIDVGLPTCPCGTEMELA